MHKTQSLYDASLIRAALWDSFKRLSPRYQIKNPVMFVVWLGSVLTSGLFIQALVGTGRGLRGLHPRRFRLAVVHRAVRQFRRGHGRRPRQGPGRGLARAAPDGVGEEAATASSRFTVVHRAFRRPAARRRGAGPGRRCDPRRRRGDRRRGLGGRVGHHRRIGAGDPRVGRRFLRRHRRHPGAVRLGGDARDGQSGRDLSRPHDRHGGGGQAPEDPQRDRADHPAGGADARLPHGHRDPAAVLAVQCGGGPCGHADHGYCADRAAGVSDPHHHRRAALGHRNSRHGPHDGKKCHCHLGTGGGGGRRRGRAAAGQDRHHHPGQPAGGRFRSGAGCAPGRAYRGRDARLDRRRDSGRPLDRDPRQGKARRSRAATSMPRARASCTSPPRRA